MAVCRKALLMFVPFVLALSFCAPIAFAEPSESGTGEAAAEATQETPPSYEASTAGDADAYVAPDEEEYQSSVAKGKADEYQQGELSSSQGAASSVAAQVPWLLVVVFALVAAFAVVCIVMALRLSKKTKAEKKPVKTAGAHSAAKTGNSSKARR